MTECQIVGGPLDGQVLDTAGNPERGEKVAHDGSFYRLYERPDRSWVAVWGGYLDFDPEDLTDVQADRPLRAIRDHDVERKSWATRIGHGLAFVIFCASLGAAFGLSFLILAALGWLVELVAGFLGGYLNFALWTAALGAALGLGGLVVDPDLLERTET